MNGYQWTVLFAAWLGWGFDFFDGLLFNYVAPNCVPTLLGLTIGSPAARAATLKWGGILTSLLLDRMGDGRHPVRANRRSHRPRAHADADDAALRARHGDLRGRAEHLGAVAFRVVASLGIGGEWAAGAAMVAEVVPEKRRVEAGALLYTSAPFGPFLATFANFQIAGVFFKGRPRRRGASSFCAASFRPPSRSSCACSCASPSAGGSRRRHGPPALRRALHARDARLHAVRIRDGGRSRSSPGGASTPSSPSSPPASPRRGQGAAASTAPATLALVEHWKALATNVFNLGGLIGTLLTIPAAKLMGRRKMFALYYFLSASAVLATFGLDLAPQQRLYMYFFIGLTVFGVFGSFTYYLPELFPTRLRGTGAGFCYNVGRFIAAAGPFLVGTVAARGTDSLQTAIGALFWIGVVPLVGVALALSPIVIETKGRELA